MKNTMRESRGIFFILLAMFAMLVLYTFFGPKAAAGTKTYSLEVVDDKEETTTYEGKTDAEYLRDLMEELAEKGDFSYEGEDGQYGLYIQTVNGLTADFSQNGAYWAIYVNGEYGQYSADQQPVEDGDAFRLVYEN